MHIEHRQPGEMPPPGPSSVIVRTPYPFGPPLDVSGQVHFPWWGWLVLLLAFGLPFAYVVHSLLMGG